MQTKEGAEAKNEADEKFLRKIRREKAKQLLDDTYDALSKEIHKRYGGGPDWNRVVKLFQACPRVGQERFYPGQETLLEVIIGHGCKRDYRVPSKVLKAIVSIKEDLASQPNLLGQIPLQYLVEAWPRAPPDLVLAMLNAYPDAAKIPGVLIVASNQNAEGDLDLSRPRLPLEIALLKGVADEVLVGLVLANLQAVHDPGVKAVDVRTKNRLQALLTREKIEAREVVQVDVREALLNPTVLEKKVGAGFNMRALMVEHVHAIERDLDVDRSTPTSHLFVPPIHRARGLKSLLKCCELALMSEALPSHTWGKTYKHNYLEPLLAATRKFLLKEVAWARGHTEILKQVFQVLRLRFVKMFWKVMETVSNRDHFRAFMNRPGAKEVVTAAKDLRSKCQLDERPPPLQQTDQVPLLYEHAAEVMPKFVEAMRKLADTNEDVFYHRCALKSMYRVMERATWGPHVALATAQRLAGDDDQVVTPAGSCAHVRDVVRGVLEFKSMVHMQEVLQQISLLESERFWSVAGVNRRWIWRDSNCAFETPRHCDRRIVDLQEHIKKANWGAWQTMINFALKPTTDDQDVTLHVILASDPNKHICEIQLVQVNLKRVRKELGDFYDYEQFRSARELLESTGHKDTIVDCFEVPEEPPPNNTAERPDEQKRLLATIDMLMQQVQERDKLLRAKELILTEKDKVIVSKSAQILTLKSVIDKMSNDQSAASSNSA